MIRVLTFLFSIASYGSFLLVFLYLIAFLGNLQTTALADALPFLKAWIPYSIDLGRAIHSPASALVIDLALLALFGVQHSVMARPGFKRVWTKVVPKEAERSVYVLIASAVLALLMWQWRPNPTPVLWHAESAWGVAIGHGVMGLGVATLLWATFLIDHFELLGLKQGWAALRRKPIRYPSFVTPYLYRIVRHPQYLGWLMIFWGTPTLTGGHLLFAAGMSVYIVVAIQFEERDLIQHIGPAYEHYRKQVPPLVPIPGRRYVD